MKRTVLFFLITMMLVVSGCRSNNIENIEEDVLLKPDCVVSHEANGDYNLTIIANREEIVDKEAFAYEIIEQVRNNDFKKIMFSYDENGYPVGLRMTVYLSEKNWQNKETEPYMTISFRQESIVNGYNIVDDYDKFKLEID